MKKIGSQIGLWFSIILIFSSTMNASQFQGLAAYQFPELSPFFDQDLFALTVDYNSFEHKIDLLADLLLSEYYSPNDTDLLEDNIITLISYHKNEINSAILGIEKVVRTHQFYGQDHPITYQTPLPFIKLVNHYTHSTGFDVVSSQEILGIALKIGGGNFNPSSYQLGYANLPFDLINLILGSSAETQSIETLGTANTSISDSPYKLEVNIEENENLLRVDLIYSNVTYLFQTEGIGFFEFEIGENLILIHFNSIKYSLTLSKYTLDQENGVESKIEVEIGDISALLINEELPDEEWQDAFEYHVEEDFYGLFELNETISYYSGPDIPLRLDLFDSLAFSLLSSQNFGLLNGTNTIKGIDTYIDGANTSKKELENHDYLIKDQISLVYDEIPLYTSFINGREFALQNPEDPNQITLLPMNSYSIALNLQTGLASNLLFGQETSIVRDIVSECVLHYSENQGIKELSPDQLYNIVGLYLQSSRYIQDSEVLNWTGEPISFQLLDILHAKTPEVFIDDEHSRITPFYLFPSIFALLLVNQLIRKRRNG